MPVGRQAPTRRTRADGEARSLPFDDDTTRATALATLGCAVARLGSRSARRVALASGGPSVPLGVLDRAKREIYIVLRPVQMSGCGALEPQNRFNGGLFEPRELFEGKEELATVDEHPEAMLGNVGDFSGRNGGARHP